MHSYIPRAAPNDANVIINIATYTIDADSLIFKNERGYESCYRYGFYEGGKMLKLVKAGWIPSYFPPKSDNGEILLTYETNITILQQKNEQT